MLPKPRDDAKIHSCTPYLVIVIIVTALILRLVMWLT